GTSLRGWTSTGSGPTRTPVDGSSIQRCAIPGPPGPEASTVSGTRSHPSAADTSNAATSRGARLPAGKSTSGRSPAEGLYTHESPSGSTHLNTALLPEGIRCTTVSSGGVGRALTGR